MLGLNKKKSPNGEAFRKGFAEYIPEGAVDYVMSLWQEHPFSFKIARSRKTCLGNYMFKNGHHFISVNGDTNRYSFLITLIHEIAHQRVNISTHTFLKKRVDPHGQEWKQYFKILLAPLLNPDIFPENILPILIQHMKNPAASSTRDPALMLALDQYSKEQKGIFLNDVHKGAIFNFKGKLFRKIEDRRTRTLVECSTTKKRYTIPSIARVETT